MPSEVRSPWKKSTFATICKWAVFVFGMHETSRFQVEQKQIHRGYYRYTRTLAIKVTECVHCFISVFFTAHLWSECNIEDVILSSTLNHFVRSTSTGAISPNASTGAMGLSWTPNFGAYPQEHIFWSESSISCKATFDFFVTLSMRGNIHHQD